MVAVRAFRVSTSGLISEEQFEMEPSITWEMVTPVGLSPLIFTLRQKFENLAALGLMVDEDARSKGRGGNLYASLIAMRSIRGDAVLVALEPDSDDEGLDFADLPADFTAEGLDRMFHQLP